MNRWGAFQAALMAGVSLFAAPLCAQSADPAPAPAWIAPAEPVAPPAPAELVAPPAPAAIAPAPAIDPAVEYYYAARPGTLIWLKDETSKAGAAKVAEVLRAARIDGLPSSTVLADKVAAAILAGGPASDKIISDAWVRFIRAWRAPVGAVHFGDPALQLKPPAASDLLGAAASAPALATHVAQASAANPFYTALRDASALDGTASDPRVRATLERLRLIPATGRAIVIDVASAHLWAIEDGHTVDNMKVIIGKAKSPSTLMAGTIHYVTFNPYWNIPEDVTQSSIAKLVLKRGTKYLKAARYETWSAVGTKGEKVDPDTIDWKAVAEGTATTYVRQLPGANNMMGAMKFGFVNDYDIFLHDTPRRALFAKANRMLSLGCVRLEHADRLAAWLGKDPKSVDDRPEQHVALEKARARVHHLVHRKRGRRQGRLCRGCLRSRPAGASCRRLHAPRRAQPLGSRQPLLGDADRGRNRVLDVQLAGIQLNRIRSSAKRSNGPQAVALVTRVNIGQHLFEMGIQPALLELLQPAPGAHFRRRGYEQFHLGTGRNYRSDVAAIEHRAAGLRGEVLLPLEQLRAHAWIGGDRRGDARHRLAAELGIAVVGAEIVARAKGFELVARIAAPTPQIERDLPVEQAGVHVRKAEMLRQRARNGAFAARRGPVDRDHRRRRSRVIEFTLVCQARRFDSAKSLWQGAARNAVRTVAPATKSNWS